MSQAGEVYELQVVRVKEEHPEDDIPPSHRRFFDLTNAQIEGMKPKDVAFKLMAGCHNIDATILMVCLINRKPNC